MILPLSIEGPSQRRIGAHTCAIRHHTSEEGEHLVKLMGKSRRSVSARARSEEQQKEAWRHTAPDARIPTGVGACQRFNSNQKQCKATSYGHRTHWQRLAEISLVPLVPTHCDAVKFRRPQNAQFFADVAAMNLNSFDADAECFGDLPGGITTA
jgi:hypothetical protein